MYRTFIRRLSSQIKQKRVDGKSNLRRTASRRRRSLLFESLEQRALLSATAIPEFALDDTVQVSAGLPYSHSDWIEPHVSADGRYAAFASPKGLVAEDTNGLMDVYVVDLLSNDLTWASQAHDGSPGADASWKPEISPDGRYVAFASRASNLVIGDQDPSYDVFVFDRSTGDLECLTINEKGDAFAPRFSGDGQRIVYEFEFNDLALGNPNAQTKDVVLLDRATDERVVVTAGIDGSYGNDITWRPHISEDGQFVVFQSQSSNLVADDVGDTWDVFLYDVAATSLECISVDANGAPANGESTSIRVSAEGRYVTFESTATNLTAPNTDSFANIYLLDRATNELKSIAGDAGPNSRTAFVSPDISDNGRFIVYHSAIPGAYPTSPNNVADAFIYDSVTGETKCLTVQDDGSPTRATNAYASISGSGNAIVFLSDAETLTSGPRPIYMDLFAMANPFLPIAVGDDFSIDEDGTLDVSADSGILINDGDPDGQAIVTALVQGPSHGTLSLGLDGSFTYTPAANFNGIDTFMYQAVDSSGRQSNVAAVTITVNSVIDAVVDIKPGNDRNKINLRGKGSVPIAVLSTEASIGEIEDFDATKVRLDTIKLNGADITPAGYAFTDVDGDGDLDLLLQFSKVDFLTQGVLDSDSIDIVFTAELDGGGADGPDLIGSDSVNTKLPKPRGKSGK